MAHRLPLADIRFIADFAAYARGKEPDGEYDYFDISNCACAQFLRDTGRAVRPSVGGTSWGDRSVLGSDHVFPEGVQRAISKMFGPDSGWTWGKLADRLEALIADAPMVRS